MIIEDDDDDDDSPCVRLYARFIAFAENWHEFVYEPYISGPYARGVWGCTKTPPPNSQKYTKKVDTVCISKIQGSFITL